MDESLLTGESVLTAASGKGTGGGVGSITLVQSADGSVGVTGGAGPTVNLSVPAQFGADTVIKLPNSASTLVKALELLTSLNVSTPGSEGSQWLFEILVAGAQFQTLLLDGQVKAPDGTQANPGFSFIAEPGTGIWRQAAGQGALSAAHTVIAFWAAGVFGLNSVASKFRIGVGDSLCQYGRLSANGGTQLLPGNSDVALGVATGGGFPTGTTTGFVDFPSMGIAAPDALPTEVVGPLSQTVFANGGMWYVSNANAWRAQSRRGKGSDIATAGTLTVLPAERTRYSYFHLTGSTAVNFLSYVAADIYGDIGDGEEIVFYCVAGTTFNFETAAPPANSHPFKTVGGASAVIAAGGKICFRRDDALGFWVEMYRTGA